MDRVNKPARRSADESANLGAGHGKPLLLDCVPAGLLPIQTPRAARQSSGAFRCLGVAGAAWQHIIGDEVAVAQALADDAAHEDAHHVDGVQIADILASSEFSHIAIEVLRKRFGRPTFRQSL